MHFSGEAHEPPTPEELADWQRRGGPRENEVGVALAWSGVLGRGPDIAALLAGATVYSTGIQLQIAVRARTSRRGGELFHAVNRGEGGPDRLLLGVELADGRTVAGGDPDWPPQDLAAEAPSLTQGGGGGATAASTWTCSCTRCPRPARSRSSVPGPAARSRRPAPSSPGPRRPRPA